MTVDTQSVTDRVSALVAERTTANRAFFQSEADRIARLCHRMAERFASGGKLVAFGQSPAARSDARHVAVEFVHPVIVGKRALPAIACTAESGPLARQAELICAVGDIAMGFEADDEETRRALQVARQCGCLTIAFASGSAEWEFLSPTDDPFVQQELVETLYHVLWESVHVFFEHCGLLHGRTIHTQHDAGRSSFLYPFLGEQERDIEAVMSDVRRSVLMKADEIATLRQRTVEEGTAVLLGAAAALRERFERGGKVLALGNGGSATDAMDAVADFRWARGWPSRPAIDLTEDTAILTALANDIGADVLFARQIIAYGCESDAMLVFSTSGSSVNIIQALAEGKRRKLCTIAFVGSDGGRIASERLADFVVVAPSPYVPRIQEAQATAYHILRELVEIAY